MTYKQEIISRTILSLPIWKTRIAIKNNLLKLNIRKVSYCKRCGIDVRDFSVSDEDWNETWGSDDGSGILCYNCFKDIHYLHGNCKCYCYDLITKKRSN